jgi:hypothetical protein
MAEMLERHPFRLPRGSVHLRATQADCRNSGFVPAGERWIAWLIGHEPGYLLHEPA